MLEKYPGRGRVFKANYAGVGQEATSESTFSEAGRAFTPSRTDIDPRQLCNSIVCHSGEKRRTTEAPEVQAAYKKMKTVGVAERAAAKEAAEETETAEEAAEEAEAAP